jgi:hypothetical protein
LANSDASRTDRAQDDPVLLVLIDISQPLDRQALPELGSGAHFVIATRPAVTRQR